MNPPEAATIEAAAPPRPERSTARRSARATDAVTGRYLPALDGVRAAAIAGVFAYHLGYGWASGGYLGVDLFFVLSGFLITTLLVEEWSNLGSIDLGRFWGHRARRLLPGLLAMLVVLALWVKFESGGLAVDLPQLRGDGIATVLYVANWHFLFSHQSYFDRFSLPSPLRHTWSLAIEEQFYLVWPLIVVAMMKAAGFVRGRGRTRGQFAVAPSTWRAAGIFCTATGALCSTAWMAYLALGGASINRLYYGTDTRALDLLVGCTLAMLVAARPQPGPRARRVLHWCSPVAVLVLAACWITAGDTNGNPLGWMFKGGFLLCAVAGAVVLADVRQVEQGGLAKALSVRPVRFVGRISYGLYLWHWPVIVELSPARTGWSGWQLDALRIGASLGLATVSYYLIERPFRTGTFLRWPVALRAALAPLAMGVASIAIVAATFPAAAAATPEPVAKVSTAPTVPGAGGVVGRPISLGFTPSPAHKLRVLLIGDSVMLSDSPAVAALLGSTGVATVVNDSQWGWGMSTAKDWQGEVAGWVRAAHPQLVIGMWSWDNLVLTEHPAEYRAELEQLIRILLAPGDGVRGMIFQQFPLPGVNASITSNQADALAKVVSAIDKWDALGAAMATAFPGRVMYFPVGSSVLLDGRFTSWLPPEGDPGAPKSEWTRVRMIDNVHFCPAGAARYSAALLADLDAMYHLPSPTPGWWKGAWTQNYVAYRFPTPAVCPNDHP